MHVIIILYQKSPSVRQLQLPIHSSYTAKSSQCVCSYAFDSTIYGYMFRDSLASASQASDVVISHE